MNKKNLIVIILLSLVILILGVIIFKKSYNVNLMEINETFLDRDIRNKEIKIKHWGELLENGEKDKYNTFFFQTYQDALTIIDLINELQKEIDQNARNLNINKVIEFSNNRFYISEELMRMLMLLNNTNYGIQEKRYILLIIKNYYLQECISHFYAQSVPLIGGEVINYAKRDTVNLGEIYKSQILFNAIDILGNITVFENGDTIRYSNFEEKATKRGYNNKKGHMQISYGESTTAVYDVSIEYYVK